MADSTFLGVPRLAFEASFLAATNELGAVPAAAIELGAERIEPSHVLLALSGIADGLTARRLREGNLPPASFAAAFRQAFQRRGAPSGVDGLTRDASSPAILRLFAELKEEAARGTRLGEREVLIHTLELLEPRVRNWLSDLGRIDPDRWREQLAAGPAQAASLFGEPDDLLDLTAFSAGAVRVLEIMRSEAQALGYERMTTSLLLYALAATPEGLLEQAMPYIGRDIRSLREQLFLTLSARPRAGPTELRLARASFEQALVLALEAAALAAAADGRDSIAEVHLFRALLESPVGLTARVVRDASIDAERLLGFGHDYYREPPPPEPVAQRAPRLTVAQVVEHLGRQVVGQAAALERIARHVVRARNELLLGCHFRDRATATFLFCGPSGSGKTMTARALAELVYGSADDLLLFEMGQFNDRISINNFIGAPPGYVGFGQGKLTNGLRDKPRQVLLFDEVEKADPTVFDALLRLLDEGRIDDPAGPVRDAREAVIVLTSNEGTRQLAQLAGAAGGVDARELQAELRRILEGFFRPEFLNRVDEVIVFGSLEREHLLEIAARRIEHLRSHMDQQLGVGLVVSEAARARIADEALEWRREEAARGVLRVVELRVVGPVLDRLVDEEPASPGQGIVVDVDDGGYVVRDAVP